MKDIHIPYYNEINDFLESIPTKHRTYNPSFYCMRLEEHREAIYKPPFRRGFYFLGLLYTEGNTHVLYNNRSEAIKDSFLTFQSPNLVYSFNRDKNTNGYLIYFKPDCFEFFKPSFLDEFPFFDILNTNLFQLNKSQYQELSTDFEGVFKAYENPIQNHKAAIHKLFALLYQLKEFTIKYQTIHVLNARNLLAKQFIQLVNVHYLEKKTVEEYALILNISAGHLSKSVKSETGKNALFFINSRIIQEAKSLILHTNLTIAEIAHQLQFTEASNFGKLFKKYAKNTPLTFRKEHTNRNLP